MQSIFDDVAVVAVLQLHVDSFFVMGVLETRRLRLRQWKASDANPFASINADHRVMEFFPSVLDQGASDALLRRFQAGIAERGWGMWAVETKAEEDFVGFVGLQPVPDVMPFAPAVEVGWRLAFDQWGKGYATEAAKAAVAFGFNNLDLHEIVSFTVATNQRSRAVMGRLGMRVDPETFEHPRIAVGSPLRLHCLYRLQRNGPRPV